MFAERTTAESEQPSPYIYLPNVPLAVTSAIAFTLVTVVHTWLFVRGKTWFFWAMLVGALMECIGFVARAISAGNLTEPYSFVVGYLMIILAPSFIAAACYITFVRIVWSIVPIENRNFKTIWVPPRFLTLIFVLFDLGSFSIQFIGASAIAAAYSDKKLSAKENGDKSRSGMSTLRFGLVLYMRFLVVSRSWIGKPLRYGTPSVKWTRLNWTVIVAATVIMLRAVYRMLEFTGNHDSPSYLQSHEWPFWVLDALPMLG
ncbi:hypothetical protein BU23DRAFT_638528 [Bimuria novae-zelandiae CBS 107.79]|uniref:RTA1 like protein n=1 Tax=Bimuria novae-zelandiae CBS 107.79 TaxID=1447943 RepID=A0A6A5VAZ4_9PLEO|nr:hypothetical protein BU23DRAFT_638528 [Bimuria novae-zelandiae CBS 107.79]